MKNCLQDVNTVLTYCLSKFKKQDCEALVIIMQIGDFFISKYRI